jgi:hypothetical protein
LFDNVCVPPVRNPSDRVLVAQLSGRAIRLARDKRSIAEAIADLRERAGGRSDLLAETAGLMGGYWSATSATQSGDYVVAFGLLIMAGADHDRIAEWVDVGRKRGQSSRQRP